MSDYPMLISNKLHSFRNFIFTNIYTSVNLFIFCKGIKLIFSFTDCFYVWKMYICA